MRFNAPTTTLRGGFAAPITGIAPRRDLAPDRHRPYALMNYESLSKIPAGERKIVRDTILDEVRGRMLEDIVLLETIKTKADGPVSVFKLQFAAGEYDMVVADSDALTCALYEVKHTTTPQLWLFPHFHNSIIPHSHIFSPPTPAPQAIPPPRRRRERPAPLYELFRIWFSFTQPSFLADSLTHRLSGFFSTGSHTRKEESSPHPSRNYQ